MINLFSSFDPMTGIIPLNWLSSFTCTCLVFSSFWMTNSQYTFLWKMLNSKMHEEFANLIKGPFCITLNSIFLFLVLNNFMGLFPYIFTSPTHFPFSLAMALPLWLGHMMFTTLNKKDLILIHLTPLGTPVALQPFMVLIELVSNIIRPLTLSIRLTANMIAGHLILTLIGSQSNNTNFVSISGLMLVIILVLLLESAVAIIQAYVFSILSTLYVKELDDLSFQTLT